ncbi:MAG: NPCBM/NEW2 domain-containing protein [Pirellulales bacterium]
MRESSVTAAWCLVAIVTARLAIGADPTQPPPLLITTEARLANAAFVSAEAGGTWAFKSADDQSERTVPLRTVVRWGGFAKAVGGHRVRLVGGGEIVGYSVQMTQREVILESDLLDQVKLPRAGVAAVIFDLPADEASAQALERRIEAAGLEQDTLLFANGDRLAGELVGLAEDKLTLKTAEADLVVDRSRAAAVIVGRAIPPEQQKSLKTWIGLRDGSRFLAEKLVLKDARVTVELAAGGTVSLSADAILALQPVGGDTIYLSDLEDAGYRHIPFLSLAWGYRRDRGVTGGPLSADSRLHLKGLGMHSAARITYNLDAEYRALQAELAIDDSTEGRGSVICRAFVDDGSGKWQLKYESGVIRGGDKPLAMNVDLAGAKRISLLVDFADRGDELDHVNWLDARLVK